ncbi:hypothetical protein EYR41_003553 [Orbilia oligospora]|uniref:Uncharacterized protein n=1 Tax=Orbilia oligospora TaxID=2813651 RepID=A0A8H2HTD1_ORBOL|nr:hypothetical protein EYR41_003553 [Orbilia oligospora]
MFLTHQNPNIPCWPSNSILKNTYACRVSRSARDREKSQSSYVKVRGVKILMLTNMSSTHLKLWYVINSWLEYRQYPLEFR